MRSWGWGRQTPGASDRHFLELYDVSYEYDVTVKESGRVIKGHLNDVTKLSKTVSITLGPHSGFSCQAVARGLSPKPLGRFSSFFAGKLI